MQQVNNVFPTTMGDMPSMSSTTATAVAGAEQRSNQRANYKSLTFEYTALTELYWMIQQMTFVFAKPETGFKLMGDMVYDFNPTLNYTYKPLSQSIETEYSKGTKIRNLLQMLGYIVNVQHPNAVNMINAIFTKVFELMGDEYVNIVGSLLNPQIPTGEGGEQAGQTGMQGGASNEQGIPQSGMEVTTRDNSGGGNF